MEHLVRDIIHSINDCFDYTHRYSHFTRPSPTFPEYTFESFFYLLGGLAAVLYTDLVQTFVMLVGAILLTGIGTIKCFFDVLTQQFPP